MGDRFPFGVGHPRHYSPVGFNPLDNGPSEDNSLRGNPSADSQNSRDSADSVNNVTNSVSEPTPAPQNAELSAAATNLEEPSPLLNLGVSDDLTFTSLASLSESGDADEAELPSLPIEPTNSGDSTYGGVPASEIKSLFDLAEVPAPKANAHDSAESQALTETASDSELSGPTDNFAWLSAASLGLPPVTESEEAAVKAEISKAARHRAR